MGTFGSYGYVPLEPPSVEFARAATSVDEHRVLRFLDRDGSLLALRPDLTTAIARVVAQRYREARGALRLAYFTTVFRQERSMRGSEREYDQAGIELIGPSEQGRDRSEAPATSRTLADAEVVALLADALCACGLASAELDIGHAAFLAGFLDDLAPSARDDALARARAGDLVGLVAVAKAAGLARSRVDQLRTALRHRGPFDPFVERRNELPARSAGALEELRALAGLLAAAELPLALRYDLGLVPPFDYYTGAIFQAVAPGLGFPVASGGRYDGLLARYGTDRPATGFGIAVPHLHQAIVAAGWSAEAGSPLVTLEGGSPERVLRMAARLRRQGLAVAIGAVAESAGRARVAVKVVDDERVETDGRTMGAADLARSLRGGAS